MLAVLAMRRFVATVAGLGAPGVTFACSSCRAQVHAQIFETFGGTFFAVIAPVAAIVVAVLAWGAWRHVR